MRVIPRFLAFFRKPEPQFLMIMLFPLLGFFFVFYRVADENSRDKVIIIFFGAFIILLLQMCYSLYAHRRLMHQERAFLSVSAHQMRTPLTAVRWIMGELGHATDVSSKELRQNADIALERLNNIIDSFSQFARIDEGQFANQPVDLDLCEALQSALHDASPVAAQYGVVLTNDGSCKDLWVRVDPVHLEMVFSNLINNGIKYNRRGGAVSVSARPLYGNTFVEISVRDTGMGVPAAEQGRLFERFFRGAEARRVNTLGTGLGLYLTREIIEAHGGTIRVESTPGKGTAFIFTLPRAG